MKKLSALIVLGVVSGAFAASAQEMAPIYHNGSRLLITKNNGKVEISYESVRPGMPVSAGTILFSGYQDAQSNYRGIAYTFKRGCEPAPYDVIGSDKDPGIILVGAAPTRDPNGCAVIGKTMSGKNARLVFGYEFEH